MSRFLRRWRARGTAALNTASGEVVTPTVTVTMPPANWSLDQHTARTMGRTGGHLALHYWLLGTAHYVWYRQGTAQPDPAIASPAELSGRTGIRVDLPASSQTAAQVATATASAIDAVEGFSATADGADVDVTGAGTASAGGVGFDERGREGIVGTPDNRAMTLNSFDGSGLRASQLDPDAFGNNPVILTGFALGVGDTHDAGIAVAIYQGGSADDDFSSASFVGTLGVTAGDGTISQAVYVQSEGVYVDPSAGRIWLAFMNDNGDAEASYTWYSQGSATGNTYVRVGNNAVWPVVGGPTSSDPEDFPSTLGTAGAGELGMLAIQISFVEASNFQRDMAPAFDFGTQYGVANGQRDDTIQFLDSSGSALVVGNSYDVPATMRGLELHRFAINYAVHVLNSDYCGHLGVGGAAVNDWSGATIYEVGQTSGTSTGWNYVSAPAGIPITESTRIWLLIEFDDSGSEVGADLGAPGQFEDDHYGPALWYNGNTSESEYGPLSNPQISPGQETTNLDYDPAGDGLQAANSAPGPWVVTPNGTNLNPGNNVGVFGTAITRGFAVAS